MEREDVIRELESSLHDLTKLHIQHRLDHTDSFKRHKELIAHFICQHDIDVRHELSPVSSNQYRRYFP